MILTVEAHALAGNRDADRWVDREAAPPCRAPHPRAELLADLAQFHQCRSFDLRAAEPSVDHAGPHVRTDRRDVVESYTDAQLGPLDEGRLKCDAPRVFRERIEPHALEGIRV